MFSIGEFAKHGRVSVRMLRHYDAIGLLRPANVDPFTGYRGYQAGQLARLNRVIALKDLGFTLDQVRHILDERVSAEQLRGMLRLRRAELTAAIEADAARLTRVEARLRTIESEGTMPTEDVIVKRLPAMRVAELTAPAAGYAPEHIGPVIKPLCAELGRRLAASTLTPTGQLTAYYEDSPDGDDTIIVHAAVPVPADATPVDCLSVVELPAVEAATVVHRGAMDGVLWTYQSLAQWIDANGYQFDGYARELYLECPEDENAWVTELQEPVIRR
ncbi:MAG TPA: MerR family transcriptional regulator [Pseudonocardiaceae bacterium]|jgi:DNA-binding transcriptional MerR regulator|nr:MerR family transcriptional regulator [Pseudonocardiaceae bacterium]